MKTVSGFSKLTKSQKIEWLASQLGSESAQLVREMADFWHPDEKLQKRFDEFSENTLTNFDFPFGIAPNFLVNGKVHAVPMVIEESSVVAAASLGAKFWLERGGFRSVVVATKKVGQVHFQWQGEKSKLLSFFADRKDDLLTSVGHLTTNMEKRGGGIVDFELVDMTDKIENYWQLKVHCETCDAMGANFINSILEELAQVLRDRILLDDRFLPSEKEVHIIMCILSNYTPECVVECSVECPIEDLGTFPNEMSAREFAEKFATAVRIAEVDPNRAVTHNKGIMNGIDPVIVATGNDWRAVEAGAHAYACRGGRYTSLTHWEKDKSGALVGTIEVPMPVGLVGGATKTHPLARLALKLLDVKSAQELAEIVVAVGLAQNLGALRALATEGIQRGHMALHARNIALVAGAVGEEIDAVAKRMAAENDVRTDRALALLNELRKS